MNTSEERLNYTRKQKGYTQDSLTQTVGVSRGIIFDMEKSKTESQTIVINTVCQILEISKEWLANSTGDMEAGNQAFQSARLLKELYDIVKELSEGEQLFLLDTVRSPKLRLGERQQVACLWRIVIYIAESQMYNYSISELPPC